MENSRARVLISINDGRIEIEGDETFVEKRLEAFKEHIEKSLAKMIGSAKPAPAVPGPPKPVTPTGNPAGLDSYSNLFAMAEDGKIQILKAIPGSTIRDKMANAAILIAFGYKLAGTNSVTFDTAREVCQQHSCLDSNFTKAVKAAKQHLVIAGRRGSQSLSLSVPGQTHAASIAAGLNSTP